MEKGTAMDRKKTRYRGIAKQQIRDDVQERINRYRNKETNPDQ
jgi:hypothetical protein